MNMNDKGKKRILFIMSSLAGGGAERVTANLCNTLCDRYDVTLVTLFDHPDAYELDPAVHRLHYSQGGYAMRLFKVGRLKKRLKPHVSVSMLQVPNLLNALCGSGDFTIMSERADPIWMGEKYYKHAKFSFARADHVVFQSERISELFSESVRRKSSIILNPVEVKREASVKTAKKIVTAGRLEEQKNHLMLIEAFAEFAAGHPEHRLEIYGDGSMKEDLIAKILDCGLEGRASVIDFTPDLHESICDAEMFVLSSDFEGLSNALLEAMMMGIPCISTNCAGSDEVIEDGVNGFLVPIRERDKLIGAMTKLADDEELRKAFAKAGKETSARFRKETVINQWIDLIENNTGE